MEKDLKYIDKMIQEHDELVDRIRKAEKFTTTVKFGELPKLEQDSLISQISCMKGYWFILGIRIEMAQEREGKEE